MNVSTVASRSERPTAGAPPGGVIDDEKPSAVLGTDDEIELVLRGELPISVDVAKREKRRRRILKWIDGGLQGCPGVVVPVEFHAVRRERPLQSDVHNDERAGTPGYDLEDYSGDWWQLFMLKSDWQEHNRERGEEGPARGGEAPGSSEIRDRAGATGESSRPHSTKIAGLHGIAVRARPLGSYMSFASASRTVTVDLNSVPRNAAADARYGPSSNGADRIFVSSGESRVSSGTAFFTKSCTSRPRSRSFASAKRTFIAAPTSREPVDAIDASVAYARRFHAGAAYRKIRFGRSCVAFRISRTSVITAWRFRSAASARSLTSIFFACG